MHKLVSLAVVVVACGAPSSSPIAQPTGPMPAATAPVDPSTMQPEAMTPAPAPTATPAAPVVPPPPLPNCVGAEDNFDAAVITTTGLSVCANGTTSAHSCWLIDLASGTWTAVPAIAAAAPSATGIGVANATIDGATVHVCGAVATDCQTLTIPNPPQSNVEASASSDRELVAVWGQDTFLRVFAVKTGKLVSTIKSWNTPMGTPASIQSAHMIGGSLPGGHDTLEVLVGYSPVSDSARLFDPRTGKLLGKVGKSDKSGPAQIAEAPPVTWANDQWVFTAFTGDRLYVHDARTAKLIKSIDVFDAHDNELAAGISDGLPGMTARTADGKSVVVVPSAIGAWPVVVFEIATGKRTTLRPPRCT